MSKQSKPIINKIAKRLRENGLKVSIESENRFYFDDAYYEPDVVARDKKTGRIKSIFEIEQGTRKHVVGGIITADYCMSKIGEQPSMAVIALTEQDAKDYRKRIKLCEAYLKNIKKITVVSVKELFTKDE